MRAAELDPLGPQQRGHTQLGRTPRLSQLLTMTNDMPQLTQRLRSQPDARQITDSQQVGQQPCVGPIGLVGTLLQLVNVSRVS